jgi:hypothetical protein
MPWSISLGARRNGRRLAQDSSGETGEYDPPRLAAYCAENFERSEISRVIAMLQDFLDKPDDDTNAKLGEDARRRGRQFAQDDSADAGKSFARLFPEATRIKQSL